MPGLSSSVVRSQHHRRHLQPGPASALQARGLDSSLWRRHDTRYPRNRTPACNRHTSVRSQASERGEAVALKSERSVIDNQYLQGLLWCERKDIAVALVAAILCTVSNLAAPVISGYLLEILAGRQPLELYPKLLGVMAVMYTIEPLLGRMYVERGIRAMERVLTSLRMEVFRVLLMQPIAFFDRRGASELTDVLAVDLDSIRSCVFGNISRDRGLRAILEASGSIAVLFYLSWQLAPVLATIIVSTGVAAALYRKATRGIEARLAAALRSLSRVAGQAFQNVRTVRAFAGENLERERFLSHVKASYTAGLQFARAKAWLEAANRSSIHLSLIILFALGGWLVTSGRMPLRVMVTGIGFTFSLMYATQGTVNSLSDLRKAASALDRVRNLLSSTRAEPQVEAAVPPGEWWLHLNGGPRPASNGSGPPTPPLRPPKPNGRPLTTSHLEPWMPEKDEVACPFPFRPMPDALAATYAATGDIELCNVTFAYPMRANTAVLQNVSVTVAHGAVTALVGRSGAGKSTVASLIARFYTPNAGSITMGGMDIHAWSRQAWSDAVALVSQEPVLFSATVADNIAYGQPQASAAAIRDAAIAANADEFIQALPNGYNTHVGEQGMQLSGGQRQRVAIARALLKNAPVLILDEATSSLDMLSERLVSEAIARLVKGRTVLVIAHRLSTIQRADRVVVISDGQVAQTGTNSELLAQEGLYSELVDSQQLALNT